MANVWSWLSGVLMGLVGWRVVGDVPHVPKMVIIGAHHTSNWDGVLLIFTSFRLKIRVHWMVKHTLMRPPLGWLLKAMGGLEINRMTSTGVVQDMVDEFNRRERMILILSPEGTRKKVRRWKRGFYYIAQGAQIPIVLAGVDYARKTVWIGPAIMPSGDLEADLVPIREFYADKTPRHPENAGDIMVAATGMQTTVE